MMKDFLTLAFIVLLFVALTPGLYVTYPRNGSKFVVALSHGIAFALILYFTHSIVRRLFRKVNEGFKDTKTTKDAVTTVVGSK
jgi:putative Mn2+ efflux pump MntP